MIVESQALLDGATRSWVLRFGRWALGLASSALVMGGCGPSTPCTSYTYSDWGACKNDGGQSRKVISSLPSGCFSDGPDGGPVLRQSCGNSEQPTNACTSFTYSAWGTCTDGSQSRTVKSSSPSGCTGGSPVLTQDCGGSPTTCTSFTYSAWGTCTNGSQSRTVASSSPAGCTGGSPVLTQDCGSSTTTCTTWTYSAWGACTNGTQTRTVASSSPSGCTGGSPVLSQSCSSLDGAALYAAKCEKCHQALARSEVKGSTAAATKGKHGNKYGTDAEMQAIAEALK